MLKKHALLRLVGHQYQIGHSPHLVLTSITLLIKGHPLVVLLVELIDS